MVVRLPTLALSNAEEKFSGRSEEARIKAE
jgi:hypothetical protein